MWITANPAPRGFEQMAGRRDGTPQLADIVAQRLAEPARLEEIALHVDDEQRWLLRLEGEL